MGGLAAPLTVIHAETREELLEKAHKIIIEEKPEKFVVGLSENVIAAEAEHFGRDLEALSGVKVNFTDETLSTFDAKQLAIAADMRRKKRHDLEDAFAAAVFLQQYVDSL